MEDHTETGNRFIFLDVDGVLNCMSTRERTPGGFIGIEMRKVYILRQAAERCGAKIVLSSSWKNCWVRGYDHAPDEDGQYLIDTLAVAGLSLEGFTVDRRRNRGEGILDYLREHPCSGYVILDDEPFDFEQVGIDDHWLRTSFRQGLVPGDLERVVEILMTESAGEPQKRETEKKSGGWLFGHFGRGL